jgi:hypothetical protein
MEWQIFVIGVLLTTIGTLGLLILNSMRGEMKAGGKSIEKLNVKVAVVIERIEYHDERIKKLEEKNEFR